MSTLQAAFALHQRGDLEAAERAYRRLLRDTPDRADAWHMLGVALLQQRRPEQAVAAIRKALALQPEVALACCNLATALLELGARDEALRWLERALALDPQLLLARCNRALALEDARRDADARDEWNSVLHQRPDHADALQGRARIALRQGRPAEACDALQALIRVAPRHAGARNLLGVALLELGRPDAALEQLAHAVQLDPGNAGAWVNQGNALRRLDRLDAAAGSYTQALQVEPGLAVAWANRATVLVDLRQPREALGDAERALELGLRTASTLNAHGAALLALHRADAALASFDEALALDPSQALTHSNRAAALLAMHRGADALQAARDAQALDPRDSRAALTEAGAWLELEQPEAALARFEALAAARPDDARALYLQASALSALRRHPEARDAAERALLLAPDDPSAWDSLASVLFATEQNEAALAAWDRALELGEESPALHNNRAVVLTMLERHAAAAEAYARVLSLDPDYPCALGGQLNARLGCCDWRDYDDEVERVEAALREGRRADTPFSVLYLPVGPDLQRRCVEAAVRAALPSRPPLWRGERYRHERIRVAYLSADFHAHATAYLMAGLFERHDRNAFETIGVSYGPDVNDAMRERLRSAFDQFLDLRLASDLEIAQRLRELEVDIAVDLKGYTRYGRLGILAHRPAPVQATYLGFPGPLGVDFVDYVLADDIVIPPGDMQYYRERVVHLPHSYQVTDDRREIASTVPSRAACGLPPTGFVFCCLNAVVKIAPPVFDVWMRLLTRVEESVLWLLDSHPDAVRNLRAEAASRGVDPARLVFAPRMAQAEHLARYRLADLFLDTQPYNAHTTASDALWAGLPVLTCRGDTFASRVGASILRAAGLPELITESLAEYESLALALALDAPRLGVLRQRLAANLGSCPLFDTDRFRADLESAYREMWLRYQRGESPASFAVPAGEVHGNSMGSDPANVQAGVTELSRSDARLPG